MGVSDSSTRRALLAGLLLTAATGTALPARSDKPTPEELFAGHLEAAGGLEALSALGNVVHEGEGRVGTQAFTFRETWWAGGGHECRWDYADGSWSTEAQLDGTAWRDGTYVGPELLTGFERWQSLLSAEPMLLQEPARFFDELRTTGQVELGNRKAWRVRARVRHQDVHETWYFDARSGLLLGRDVPRGDPEDGFDPRARDELRLSEYRQVGDVLIAHRHELTRRLQGGEVERGEGRISRVFHEASLREELRLPPALREQAGARVIAGTVISEGRPAAAVEVRLNGHERVLTGEDGRFRFEGVQGDRFAVRAERGLLSANAWSLLPPPNAEDRLQLELRSHAILRGRTVDDTGRPVPHASIRAGERGCVVYARLDSDAEGRFELPFGQAWAHLSAHAPGHRMMGRSVRLRPGEVLELDLVLPRSIEASGFVVDDRGQAAGSHGLKLVSAATGEPVACAYPADDDGAFRFDEAEPGLHHVEVEGRGRVASIEVPFEGIRIVLEGRSIEGVVLGSDGQAVELATVALGRPGSPHPPIASTFADRQGRFRLPSVPAGDWLLTANSTMGDWLDYESASRLITVTDTEPSELRVELLPDRSYANMLEKHGGTTRNNAWVRGRLVDEAGTPLAHVPVHDWENTAANGRFALLREFLDSESLVLAGRRVEIPAAPAGESIDLGDIVVRPGGRASGRIVDTHGEPVHGAGLEFDAPGVGSVVDGFGRFTLVNLPPGTVEVNANCYMCLDGDRALVSSGDDDLVLRVRPGSLLRGELQAPAGTRFADLILVAHAPADEDSLEAEFHGGNDFMMAQLPQGPIRLELLNRNGESLGSASLILDETIQPVQLVLDESGLTVRD